MARISIYVSDELKARMDEARDALNWSDIARPAFESALATFNHRKGQNMQTAVERLRASKEAYLQHAARHGKEEGRKWAANTASFNELRSVAAIDLDLFSSDPDQIVSALVRAYDPEGIHQSDHLPEMLFGDRSWPPPEWVMSWVEGAQEFFEEVEDQI